MTPTKGDINWIKVLSVAAVIGQVILVIYQIRNSRLEAQKVQKEGTVTVMGDTAGEIYKKLSPELRQWIDRQLASIKETTGIELSLSQIINSLINSGKINVTA